MGVLRSIEHRIESVVEGIFGRAFRAHVQPVELARKLAKEMDDHRTVSVSRIYVPNEYVLYLAPADRSQFAEYESELLVELGDYLSEHARREGYALLSAPHVLLEEDSDLAVGEFGIATRLMAGEAREETPPELPVEEPAQTMVYRTPVPAPQPKPEPEPEPEPDVVSLRIGGKTHAVTSPKVVIGRSRDCDVRVGDLNASRRHAELRKDGDGYWIVDLGSMNGTLVNGQQVDKERLEDGDTITLGSTDIVFGRKSAIRDGHSASGSQP
jgi:hypothetical protein